MKENLIITVNMVKVGKFFHLNRIIKDIMLMANQKVKENLHGQMANIMKENGLTAINMDMELGWV